MNQHQQKEEKEPDPNCEICSGEGYLEEPECFQNAYGEHGIETWPCKCTMEEK